MRSLLVLFLLLFIACGDGSPTGTDGGNACGECPICPSGTVCFAGDFVPECLRPCRDDRDCDHMVCLTENIGSTSGFCGIGNQTSPGQTHPAYCHQPFCSPPQSTIGPRCIDADRLGSYAPAYCGLTIQFCPHGCETLMPDGGAEQIHDPPVRGRCRP